MITFLKQQLAELIQPASLKAIGGIMLGCFIAAVGLVYFINPYSLVPGGVFGICIVLHAIFPYFQIGTYALMLQIPILLISIRVLGGKLGFRTLIATFTLPVMVNFLSWLSYPDAESLRLLDPTKLLGGHLDMTHDLIIGSLIGGALTGVGTGIIIRQQASSGGSDVLAMLLHKFTHIRFANCMLLIEGCIVLSGFIVIGLGIGTSSGTETAPRSWMLSFYSFVAMYTLTQSIAMVLNGAKDCMLVHIICKKEDTAVLHDWILNTLVRTATSTNARGIYSSEDREILLMVVRTKEIPSITEGIKQLAPSSFVVVTDAYDAYGYRWKELPDAGALNL